jgi:Cu(I)/Ag(I) efflux system membrane protein CusA/SilA
MSLGGIAIAVGAMVDAAIVVVEQTHKKLEEWERTGRKRDYHRVVIDAVKEVGGPSFFALLVIAVAFLPVLTLEAQEGRLFKPLAYTKNVLHDHRGVSGHHAGSGHAAAVHAHEEL